MAASRSYHIEDEARPGALAHLAVNPLWPLLGTMLGGSWLGFTWFALNSIAVGSPTRTRELVLVAAGFLGSVALVLGLLALNANGVIHDQYDVQYALLVLVLFKLGIAYTLYTLQVSTIGIYEYYGGTLRNGLIVLLVGAFVVRVPLLKLLHGTVLWSLVLR